MQSRREFLKAAAVLSGAAGLWEGLDATVRAAAAIEPPAGSTFRDAEHVVILMQENRSFDHVYGTLRGVRGYNDPRAITLANGDPVWVQTNAAGERYTPFRLDFKDSKSTWTGSLPHSWTSQVDARNGGLHDNWLNAKRAGGEYAKMPLTLGHYTREDVPFYYSLADAFTVFDQHFCSSVSPTLPNRLYLWTGTVREHPDGPAHMRNEQIENNFAGWTTFPERLEDAGVSWKVYQNELTVPSGFSQIEDDWLANYGDNGLEYFPQFRPNMHPPHRAFVEQQLAKLPERATALKAKLADASLSAADAVKLKKQLEKLEASLKAWEKERAEFEKPLTPREKTLHERAFVTNAGDPAYRRLTEITYKDGDVDRRVKVPEGDVFHQFRDDVKTGKLPAVSWLVAPQKLSDHPESAWYGAWYVSEALRILTENPDVWRKTIFILTYDENDGYFDHVPPFVAPHPHRPETGFASAGINTSADYVELEQDKKISAVSARESPIGLGYRVPMVIASPWTRGGCVCSQVFDHTSVLQFLETWLSPKTGKPIKEANISSWRRTVCGDLTSAFQSACDAEAKPPEFVSRDPFVKKVFQAQFKPAPSGFKALTDADVAQLRQDPRKSPWMPRQEPGVRRSCPLPYELYADGSLDADRARFTITFVAGTQQFHERSAGCPFTVYARTGAGKMTARHYAVAAGAEVKDSWSLADFDGGVYHLEVYGPNGFYRAFSGDRDDPAGRVSLTYEDPAGRGPGHIGDVFVQVANAGSSEIEIAVADADSAYNSRRYTRSAKVGQSSSFQIDTRASFQWYNLLVIANDSPKFRQRFAGRAETGHWTTSDPAMGRSDKPPVPSPGTPGEG